MWDFPLLPEQASSVATRVDILFYTLTGLSLLFLLPIVFLIFYFVVRYRKGTDVDRSQAITTSLKLELAWIIFPLGLGIGVFVWAANLYFDISTPPADALEVSVIAQQWMWKFQHAEGQREINELHVPANRPVKLIMTSQDVIHSFFVPAFRVKQDVLPGRYTTVWFEATKTGEYHLLCAEYCGTDHAAMTGTIIVLDPTQYQNWLSQNQAGQTLVSAGEQLFSQLGCESCHRADGSGRGPSLLGVYGSSVPLANGRTVTADENYIRESILQPRARIVAGYEPIMPTFEGQVSETDLVQLVSYVRSLGEGQTGQDQNQPQGQGEPAGGQQEPDQNGEN